MTTAAAVVYWLGSKPAASFGLLGKSLKLLNSASGIQRRTLDQNTVLTEVLSSTNPPLSVVILTVCDNCRHRLALYSSTHIKHARLALRLSTA